SHGCEHARPDAYARGFARLWPAGIRAALRFPAHGSRRPVLNPYMSKGAMVDAVQPPAAARPPWTVTISEDEVLTVIGHLLSSAELCLYEPELYGSFRLLDATSRFLGTLLSKEPADHDAFLLRLKQEID